MAQSGGREGNWFLGGIGQTAIDFVGVGLIEFLIDVLKKCKSIEGDERYLFAGMTDDDSLVVGGAFDDFFITGCQLFALNNVHVMIYCPVGFMYSAEILSCSSEKRETWLAHCVPALRALERKMLLFPQALRPGLLNVGPPGLSKHPITHADSLPQSGRVRSAIAALLRRMRIGAKRGVNFDATAGHWPGR